ncbi:hypothetical protein LTR10_013605 [Elasticomyces elasticus]|uniref:Uncharacterized protein n=1 Tax=Exophiala sideris TaxID=1016849 RepID=A0ABR0JQ77_9EURO|nr:hypothetical protein LTR10_013605 [Elasticomyces elasticus]KAK5039744.1 hypothetical protein LTS07_000239 [Exophiala sideris]KAK5041296.1 hypothetical protein LTR13_002771 [Exophiala sideris]KAK5068122.1 hypothetical protein LTR69_000240 [Exophiala sideris]KAK5187423.1 hypothetical protein LTR44_000239 [Eurotiomycetes sp. CCFEE 6388]
MGKPGSWSMTELTPDYPTDDDLSDFNLDDPVDDEEAIDPYESSLMFSAAGSRKDDARPMNKGTTKGKGDAKTPLQQETVFPNMKIPVRMQETKKGRGSSKGVVSTSETERKPLMQVQCPMPGGKTVTMTTDPVQKVSWGPLTRVEASQEARDLIKAYIASPEDKDVGGEKDPKTGKTKENDVAKVQTSAQATERAGVITKENDTATTVTSTPATKANTTYLARKNPGPPPSTPPDSIFHHALSMPTLPVLNRISDVNLVEQYRLQRATDPERFDRETATIKQGLLNAKLERGGKPSLLENEYTVELASREDATTVERWIHGRVVVQMRSRGNTLTNSPTANVEDVKIRGGEVEDRPKKNTIVSIPADNKVDETTVTEMRRRAHELAPTDAVLHRLAPGRAPAMLPHNAEDGPVPAKGTDTTAKKEPSGLSLLNKARQVRRELKERLQSVNLGSHVSKVTSSGTIRHQSSVKREIGDHGEKRTVKTWIEITEVYEVPSAAALDWSDVVHAVDADENDGDDDTKTKRKAVGKDKKKSTMGKAKATGRIARNYPEPSISEADSDDSDGDFGSNVPDNGSTGEEVFYDPDESRAEMLFRSISGFGRVTPVHLNRKLESLRGIIAELRGNNQVKETQE